jgi:hypothetical protein
MLGLHGPALLGAERAVSGFGGELAWPSLDGANLVGDMEVGLSVDATDCNFTRLGEFSDGITSHLVGASCWIRFHFSLFPCGGVHGRLLIMKSAVIPLMFFFHLISTEFITDSF